MKTPIVRLAALSLVGLFLLSCSSVNYRADSSPARVLPFPALRLAVLSDIHIFDPALGVSGPDWEKYMHSDRKLLAQGLETFDLAVSKIEAERPDFLLISGDLTKDGEMANHQLVASRLADLRAKGIRAFVIPGNHDVLNPSASSYGPEGVKLIPSVTPADFARIYGANGYDEALMRDPHSLSYLVEAAPGLLLLGIDSCRYEENAQAGIPLVSGRIDQGRADFIAAALQRAKLENKPVIAMMHHGLVEHFAGQSITFGEYVLDDNARVAELLVKGGVRMVFTGHFHANDITQGTVAAGPGQKSALPFWDIETGSTVTWPCPYRLIDLADTKASFRTGHVGSLPSFEAEGRDFDSYAKKFTEDGIVGLAIEAMVQLGTTREEADSLAPQIARAMVAHYAGDEITPADPRLKADKLSLMGSLVIANRGPSIEGMWRDQTPADNNLVIELSAQP